MVFLYKVIFSIASFINHYHLLKLAQNLRRLNFAYKSAETKCLQSHMWSCTGWAWRNSALFERSSEIHNSGWETSQGHTSCGTTRNRQVFLFDPMHNDHNEKILNYSACLACSHWIKAIDGLQLGFFPKILRVKRSICHKVERLYYFYSPNFGSLAIICLEQLVSDYL